MDVKSVAQIFLILDKSVIVCPFLSLYTIE